MKRTLISLLLAFTLLCGALGLTGCDPDKVIVTGDVISVAFIDAQPIFQSLIDSGQIPREAGALILKRLKLGSEISPRLAQAIAHNQTEAVALAAELISITESVMNEDASLIKDPGKRNRVLALLLVADVTLHAIASRLKKPISKSAMQAPREVSDMVIDEFVTKPRWRARSSITGKFVSRDFALKNPDTTVVEKVTPKR